MLEKKSVCYCVVVFLLLRKRAHVLCPPASLCCAHTIHSFHGLQGETIGQGGCWKNQTRIFYSKKRGGWGWGWGDQQQKNSEHTHHTRTHTEQAGPPQGRGAEKVGQGRRPARPVWSKFRREREGPRPRQKEGGGKKKKEGGQIRFGALCVRVRARARASILGARRQAGMAGTRVRARSRDTAGGERGSRKLGKGWGSKMEHRGGGGVAGTGPTPTHPATPTAQV